MTIKNEEADKEIRKFHSQLLKNIIGIVKLNRNHLDKEYKRGVLPHPKEFHNGALMFADVIIHQIKEEIKRVNSDKSRETNK